MAPGAGSQTTIMLTTAQILSFLLAAVLLTATPGPDNLMVLSMGMSKGRRSGIAFGLGCALGCLSHTLLAVIGVGALIAASPLAFTVLKWVGGAYLVWLGIQLWRAPPLQLQAVTGAPFPRRSQLFRQGLFAAVSNPKALLFYGAFLPQFLDPARSLWLQFAVMAGTFAVIECVVEVLLARMAHRIRPVLERFGKRFNRVCGGAFAAMGVALPLAR